MLTHFQKVTQSDWPGVFHGYTLADVPRTKNELEQCLGAHRYHERRATGRTGASPALGLRGVVRLGAYAATRLRSCTGAARAPEHLRPWQTRRQQLESRRQQRVRRSRFHRNPAADLARLEKDLLQLILPP